MNYFMATQMHYAWMRAFLSFSLLLGNGKSDGICLRKIFFLFFPACLCDVLYIHGRNTPVLLEAWSTVSQSRRRIWLREL